MEEMVSSPIKWLVTSATFASFLLMLAGMVLYNQAMIVIGIFLSFILVHVAVPIWDPATEEPSPDEIFLTGGEVDGPPGRRNTV